ncbi:2884_t:CDS:2 [Cetraspora pellucida]|uniref:2884_t:CDS:1 n=1 Tax=Cetraspora pellucida TaxID=1433469 RepID=A0ACA9LV38_9GLOM|nr:2884_t:CDS:2 [Cetraspora pellucida]
MLKKPVKKITNQSELKQAYDLVAKDLFDNLKKAKDKAKIELGDLGFFQKKIARIRNSFGVYRYYRINFKVKDNEYLKLLPVVGGLAFGLNTLQNHPSIDKRSYDDLIKDLKRQVQHYQGLYQKRVEKDLDKKDGGTQTDLSDRQVNNLIGMLKGKLEQKSTQSTQHIQQLNKQIEGLTILANKRKEDLEREKRALIQLAKQKIANKKEAVELVKNLEEKWEAEKKELEETMRQEFKNATQTGEEEKVKKLEERLTILKTSKERMEQSYKEQLAEKDRKFSDLFKSKREEVAKEEERKKADDLSRKLTDSKKQQERYKNLPDWVDFTAKLSFFLSSVDLGE